MAAARDLILVDTKYEFGKRDGEINLIDEIHTPDSSRYFHAAGYQQRQAAGDRQRHLSKEFVREWLIENGFQGLDGQTMPAMPDEFVNSVTDRYVELYELITGQTFFRPPRTRIRRCGWSGMCWLIWEGKGSLSSYASVSSNTLIARKQFFPQQDQA